MMQQVTMRRVEPETNTYRYYRLQLLPNLFGGVSLVRKWGRIGTHGREAIGLFGCVEQAADALAAAYRAKLKRGYVDEL